MTAMLPAPTTADGDGRGLKLYELTGEYAALKALLDVELDAHCEDAADTLDTRAAALTEALDALAGAIDKKACGIAAVYRQQNAEADWVDEQAAVFAREAARLSARAEAKRNSAKRLHAYLAEQLATLGDDTQKIVSPLVTVTLSKRPAKDRVIVTDEAALPPAFIKATLRLPLAEVPAELRDLVKATEVAKTAINEAYEQDGLVPPGCEVVPGGRVLRVY